MAGGRDEQSETLALDEGLAERLAGPALPFFEARGAVACRVLEPREGATPVPIALGTVPWRNGGPLRLTIVVKASFSMLSEPPMEPVPPDPFRSTDAHLKNRPNAHVFAASDRVPWKPSVDVTVLGHARAPAGRAVPEMEARFSLRQGGEVALEKAARVVGRRATPDAAPEPFTAIPIVYERARGGSDAPANPFGCSQDDDEQPNVLDPENPRRPAGFGPIPAIWPLRKQRLGDRDRSKELLEGPVLELPRDFDWSYFQSAPPDQLVSELAAEASLVLSGFHPERARIEVALPGARAVGAVYGLDPAKPDAPKALTFRADTLHLDADRWVCTLAWRACVDVPDETRLGHLLVVAGAGVGGLDPVIPDTRSEALGLSPSKPAAARGRAFGASTGTLPIGDRGPEPERPQPPHVGGVPPAAALPVAPAAPPPNEAPRKPAPSASPWAPSPEPAAAEAPRRAPAPGLPGVSASLKKGVYGRFTKH